MCTCQCYGPIEEFESCATLLCPEWTEWGGWSACSVTCGEGSQTRVRRCDGGDTCPGDGEEAR